MWSTFPPPFDSLLISDSEIEEPPAPYWHGANLFQVTLSGELIGTFSTLPFPNGVDYSDEPTGVSYDPRSGKMFFSDDNWGRVWILNQGNDGLHSTSDDIVTYFKTSVFGSLDPEDVTLDTWRGHLFVVDGGGTEVYDISPGPDGMFNGVLPDGDDVVTHFDTAALGISDPEGIAFDRDNGHLYILGSNGMIAETTIDGILLRYIDASELITLGAGGGMAYAPASDNSGQMSLYRRSRR